MTHFFNTAIRARNRCESRSGFGIDSNWCWFHRVHRKWITTSDCHGFACCRTCNITISMSHLPCIVRIMNIRPRKSVEMVVASFRNYIWFFFHVQIHKNKTDSKVIVHCVHIANFKAKTDVHSVRVNFVQRQNWFHIKLQIANGRSERIVTYRNIKCECGVSRWSRSTIGRRDQVQTMRKILLKQIKSTIPLTHQPFDQRYLQLQEVRQAFCIQEAIESASWQRFGAV